MAPHRSNGRGSFEIDRRFKSVGRIKIASGTLKVPMFNKLNAMLDMLVDLGRLDLLLSLKRRVISPMELYNAFRGDNLASLPSTDTIIPLKKAMSRWIGVLKKKGGEGASEFSIRNHEQALRDLFRGIKNEDALRVHELPSRLVNLKDIMQNAQRSFNMARSSASAFVRDTMGQDHPLYRAIQAVRPYKPKSKRKGNPQTLSQLFALTKKMAQPWATVALRMAFSGMGTKEYQQDGWDVGIDRIFIHGVKREGRERIIPVIEREVFTSDINVPANMSRDRVARLLNAELGKASNDTVTVADLRKTFMYLLQNAEIPRTRRRLYLGHGHKDVTDIYEAYEVSIFLNQDAKAMEAYIDAERKKSDVIDINQKRVG